VAARSVTARGERTRERLLDTAERLWGERGVEGVSLREIRLAAGQRNSSALQFHFGDRSGMLLALSQRHVPRVAALQEELYAAIVAQGRDGQVAGLTEVMVRPNADYLRRGPSERAWVKIAAQEAARPELSLQAVVEHGPRIAFHVGALLYARLSEVVDPGVALERMLSVLLACNHLCADRARLEEATPRDGAATLRPVLPFEQWRANLVDMAVGALLGPPT
jgi:AcrR family transcriptional regulator